ncbi:MAG: hypothetical protein K2X93_07235 [Candidatus Obscuribacterales bacterium]|nr:hypothetical protein [Candidatus Obscuribacterales bacterium]
MSETEGTAVSPASLIEYLKHLPWCKQGEDVLVAVHQGTPEVVDHMQNHEVRVFPGGLAVKMQKSVLTNFRSRYDEGQPLPVVIVWKAIGVEIWYRKHKPTEFPYDAWSDTAAAAYEQERVLIPVETFGPEFAEAHSSIVSKTNACPSIMPPY